MLMDGQHGLYREKIRAFRREHENSALLHGCLSKLGAEKLMIKKSAFLVAIVDEVDSKFFGVLANKQQKQLNQFFFHLDKKIATANSSKKYEM